jgi:hypothetical protein
MMSVDLVPHDLRLLPHGTRPKPDSLCFSVGYDGAFWRRLTDEEASPHGESDVAFFIIRDVASAHVVELPPRRDRVGDSLLVEYPRQRWWDRLRP